MGREIRKGEGHEITFKTEGFQTFWGKVSEWTTSSLSTIHHGHYKAAAKNELVFKINAQQLTQEDKATFLNPAEPAALMPKQF